MPKAKTFKVEPLEFHSHLSPENCSELQKVTNGLEGDPYSPTRMGVGGCNRRVT
jgi:hypothetical protein